MCSAVTGAQDVDGYYSGGTAGDRATGAGGGPAVGEWWDCIRWGMAGEGDRGGWTVVGRTWESEIRRWSVAHSDTHIQSWSGKTIVLFMLKESGE